MKLGVVIGMASVAALAVSGLAVSGLAWAQMAPATRDNSGDSRQVPHYVDNADYDPQPYYVDGVQYKPNDKKGKKADAVKGKQAAAVAQDDPQSSDDGALHPYVPTKAQVASSASASHETASHSQVAQTSSESNSEAAVHTPSTASHAQAQASATPPAPAVPHKRTRYADAIIEAVDKVTAENVRFDAPLGKSIRYKGLIYVVKACETTADDEPMQDVVAYMQVRTSPTDGPNPAPSKQIFQGWMFASSPGLNPLQHPVYDAWVVACRNPLPGTPG